MRGSLSFKIACLFLLGALAFGAPPVFAQDDDADNDDFFEEDEDVSEPIEEAAPMPGADGAPNIPFTPGNRFRPPVFNGGANDSNAGNSGGGPSNFGASNGQVEFVLVNPPKYWKPKKRKRPVLVK